jgi:hypothetical protein
MSRLRARGAHGINGKRSEGPNPWSALHSHPPNPEAETRAHSPDMGRLVNRLFAVRRNARVSTRSADL